jgi:UDP-N-acetylmuramoyl-tripeptide--D-alanyl-D-alanine ligase
LYADGAGRASRFCAIRPGDAIVIKGSPGSKMKTIVNALEKRFPGGTAQDKPGIGRIECFIG